MNIHQTFTSAPNEAGTTDKRRDASKSRVVRVLDGTRGSDAGRIRVVGRCRGGSSASVSVSPAPNCPGAVVICSDLDFRHPSPTLRTALNPLTREALAARVVV